MTGRISHAMTLALRAVGRGLSLSEAARRHGVDLRALRRACRREGIAAPPRPEAITAEQIYRDFVKRGVADAIDRLALQGIPGAEQAIASTKTRRRAR